MSAFVFLAILGATIIPSGVEVPADNCIAQISEDGQVKLQLCLPKKEFIEAEPIIVAATVRNNSGAKRKLAEPSMGCWTVWLFVKQIEGTEPLTPLEIDFAGPPHDYGWQFQPGEAKTSHVDLQELFGYPLSPGTYTVSVRYSPPDAIPDVWQGTITTQELLFTVVKPTGRGAEASKLFLEARRKLMAANKAAALEAAETFRELADPEKGSVFAQYAPFFEAHALSRSDDRERGMTALLDYAERHPDIHPYAEGALTVVGRYLYRHGRYSAARSVLQKLPEGYERMDSLRQCDEKLAEQ